MGRIGVLHAQGGRQQAGAGSWRQICPPLLFAFAGTNNSKIMRKSGLKMKNRAGSPQTVSGKGPCGVLVGQKAEMLKKSWPLKPWLKGQAGSEQAIRSNSLVAVSMICQRFRVVVSSREPGAGGRSALHSYLHSQRQTAVKS